MKYNNFFIYIPLGTRLQDKLLDGFSHKGVSFGGFVDIIPIHGG